MRGCIALLLSVVVLPGCFSRPPDIAAADAQEQARVANYAANQRKIQGAAVAAYQQEAVNHTNDLAAAARQRLLALAGPDGRADAKALLAGVDAIDASVKARNDAVAAAVAKFQTDAGKADLDLIWALKIHNALSAFYDAGIDPATITGLENLVGQLLSKPGK
jgi:hypothetical protein